jgi:hypothetical protein
MDMRLEIRAGLHEVGLALRRPEQFVVRWRDRHGGFGDAPRPSVFAMLMVNGLLGLAAYGLTMGMLKGPTGMLLAAMKVPLAAGMAWSMALPALYIINSALGSKLDASTTFLAALTTVSFGAMAMLASVPVNWFFNVALPDVQLLVNVVVFAGVAVCMVDVFMRSMKALEPDRGRFYAFVWLTLVGVIGGELFMLLKVFDF